MTTIEFSIDKLYVYTERRGAHQLTVRGMNGEYRWCVVDAPTENTADVTLRLSKPYKTERGALVAGRKALKFAAGDEVSITLHSGSHLEMNDG